MDPLYSLALVIACWDEDIVQSCSVPVTYLWTLQATDCFRSCVKITLVGDNPGFLCEHGRVKAICRQKSLVTQSWIAEERQGAGWRRPFSFLAAVWLVSMGSVRKLEGNGSACQLVTVWRKLTSQKLSLTSDHFWFTLCCGRPRLHATAFRMCITSSRSSFKGKK